MKGSLFTLQLVGSLPHVVLPAPSSSSALSPRPAPPPLASLGHLTCDGCPPHTGLPLLTQKEGWDSEAGVCNAGWLPQDAPSAPLSQSGTGACVAVPSGHPTPPRPRLKGPNGQALDASSAAVAPPSGEGRKYAASPATSARLGGHPCGKLPYPGLPLPTPPCTSTKFCKGHRPGDPSLRWRFRVLPDGASGEGGCVAAPTRLCTPGL